MQYRLFSIYFIIANAAIFNEKGLFQAFQLGLNIYILRITHKNVHTLVKTYVRQSIVRKKTLHNLMRVLVRGFSKRLE